MKQSTKNLFKAAEMITYVIVAFLCLLSLAILFEFAPLVELVQQAYLYVYGEEVINMEDILTALIIYETFGIFINFYTAKMYYILSKFPEKVLKNRFGTCVFVVTLQFLMNLLCAPVIGWLVGIIAFLGIMSYQKSIKGISKKIENIDEILLKTQEEVLKQNAGGEGLQDVTYENNIEPYILQIMARQITLLRMQKEQGVITEDVFNKELNDIISGNGQGNIIV